MKAAILTEIEEMAELQFTREEIEVILQLPDQAIAGAADSALAYRRGRLRAQAEVRKSISDMAKRGSSPAQKQFLQLAEESHAPTPEPEVDYEP